MIICGADVGLRARVIMNGTILVDILHHARIVHMSKTRDVIAVGQAIGGRMIAGQREGKRRRQHTKQIS